MGVGVLLFVEDNLNYSLSVAEVYESEWAEITALMNPTHETHDFAGVLRSEIARIMTAFQAP
jgi:hypothetical protein